MLATTTLFAGRAEVVFVGDTSRRRVVLLGTTCVRAQQGVRRVDLTLLCP